MGTFLLVLQIITALMFIVLMAVQTDKADAGGVMGLGGQGGRVGEEVDMPVGAERILKPLSKWTAIGFLFLSILAAMNGEIVATSKGAQSLPFWVLLIGILLYLFIMFIGDRLWKGFTDAFGK